MKEALSMTGFAEKVLGLSTGRVLVGSTGRIGVQMPMEQVARGIVSAAEVLGSTPEHAAHAAEAIMTSDSRPKTMAIELKIGGRIVRKGGN
ncbi:MAG: bifunctional ornithine acetyltransferase/N-acetylglutamate synthase [bacterium]